MDKQRRYPPEVRERSVRMVLDHTKEHGSQWATICSIAGKLGMTSETLWRWVRQTERDGGLRTGLTSDERTCMKELEFDVYIGITSASTERARYGCNSVARGSPSLVVQSHAS